MNEEIVLKEIEVRKLALRPGDVAVFTLPENTRHDWMRKLAAHLNTVLPRNKALIICGDVKIEVLAKEEAEKVGKSSGLED